MPDLKPAPEAEDIDEAAAQRSVRVLMAVMGAMYVSVGLVAVLVWTQVTDRPGAVNERVPPWAIAFIVAITGITLAASVWWMRRQYRLPVYRRVMQYGWRRRRMVTKDLLRGRSLSAEDMPVAAALVDLQRSQGRWLVIVFSAMPFIFVFNGFNQQGYQRWFQFGVAAFWVVFMPFIVRQRRQIIRNYERLLMDGKQ